MRLLLASVLAVAVASAASGAALMPAPASVRVDGVAAPLVTGVLPASAPRFSWQVPALQGERDVAQDAYRVVVSTSAEGVVYWDSGVVKSSQSLHVLYEGKPLAPSTRYTWTVQVWDNQGRESEAAHSEFITAITAFKGKWIGGKENVINEVRKEFALGKAISSAVAHISGLGYYELFINGKQVDPTRKLDPAWTTFEKRVLYSTFDVTSLVVNGANAIGIMLGNGWYSQEQSIAPNIPRPTYGPPRVIMDLFITFADGTSVAVVTDQTWSGRQGSIIYDSVYHGEHIDARRERPGWTQPGFKDPVSFWMPVDVMAEPGGELLPQTFPPIRVMKTIKPKTIRNPLLNLYVVDFGQNFVGWIRLKVKGPRGTHVSVKYAEIIEHPHSSTFYDGMIYTDNLRAAEQTDLFILKGDANGETFEPRFTAHGFRYIQIMATWGRAPSLDQIEGVVVYSEMNTVGAFKSDNPVLNKIHENTWWGQVGNLLSLPLDCPQRDERKGWTGDSALTTDEALFNLGAQPFFMNWLQDINDEQDATGGIPDTVPWAFGDAPADPNWGTVYPTVVTNLLDHYSDTATATKHYTGVRKWVDLMISKATSTGLAKMFYHYGDWVPPPPAPQVNRSYTSAFAMANDVLQLIAIAKRLGNTADAAKYEAIYATFAVEFHKVFYNRAVKGYLDGCQSANVLALALPSVVPANLKADVVASLVKDIADHGNHLTTGIVGTKHLLPVLSENGHADLALTLAGQTTYPSWGYMFLNKYENATTQWELWDAPFNNGGMNSRNHIMYGTVDAWMYRYLAGIRPNGMETIEIEVPVISYGSIANQVSASYDSIKGRVSVDWTRSEADSLDVSVTIPPNAQGILRLPADFAVSALEESGSMLWPAASDKHVSGIRTISVADNGDVEVHLASGSYEFSAKVAPRLKDFSQFAKSDNIFSRYIKDAEAGKMMKNRVPTRAETIASLKR